jgi:hypothetical protein
LAKSEGFPLSLHPLSNTNRTSISEEEKRMQLSRSHQPQVT